MGKNINKEFFTEAEAQSFFNMVSSKDINLVNFALDMMITTELFLPYRYNERGGKLPEILKGIKTDCPWYTTMTRSEQLQKKINCVRAKHTYERPDST